MFVFKMSPNFALYNFCVLYFFASPVEKPLMLVDAAPVINDILVHGNFRRNNSPT